MNIKPISYSEFWLWQNRPNDWYSQYILGIPQEPSREMELGSLIHSALEDKNYDWKKELQKNNFTPDYERTVGQILAYNYPNIPEREVWLNDYGQLYYECGNIPICGIADGLDREKNILYEWKSGKSFWTQARTDEHKQIDLYSYLCQKLTGKIPDVYLYSLNVSNGKVKLLQTKRTEEQIKNICEEIKQVVEEIKLKGWWEKRISSKKQ